MARAFKDYGQRVQYSVFEIELEPGQWALLRARLALAHLLDAHPRTPERWPALARWYLDHAWRLLTAEPPPPRPAPTPRMAWHSLKRV